MTTLPNNPPSPVTARTSPFVSRDTYEKYLRMAADKLYRYIDQPRVDYQKPAAWVRRDLDPTNARYLNANNIEARITFAKRLVTALKERPSLFRESIFLVTITSQKYFLPVKRAHELNIFSLQQLTRQALTGCPFIGMIELALYKNWGPGGPTPYRDHVFMHSHNIVFGKTKAEILAATSNIGLSHVNVSGGNPVHIKAITPEEVSICVRYLLKPPLKEYRLNAAPGEMVDNETGEVLLNVKQQKREMRTGDRVRLCNAMKDMNIDDLFFGGGEGHDFVKFFKREMLRPVTLEETRAAIDRAVSKYAHRPAVIVPNRDAHSRFVV